MNDSTGKVETINNDVKTSGITKMLLDKTVNKNYFVLETTVNATDCDYPTVGFSIEDSNSNSIDVYLANLFTRIIQRNQRRI